MERTPLADAASDLAQAAFELVERLTVSPDLADAKSVFTAVRRFYVVYDFSVGEAAQDDCGELFAGTAEAKPSAPPRFRSAISAIEPGVFDPAVIAHLILTGCEEVIEEGGFPALDPAIRLLAAQLSWLCSVTANLRDAGALMFACTRRTFEG